MGQAIKPLSIVAEQIKKSFPDLNVVVKEGVITARAKSLEMDGDKLRQLAADTKGYTINFGRSAANFRMLIK